MYYAELLKSCNSWKVSEFFLELQPFKNSCVFHYNDSNLITTNRSKDLLKLNMTYNVGTWHHTIFSPPSTVKHWYLKLGGTSTKLQDTRGFEISEFAFYSKFRDVLISTCVLASVYTLASVYWTPLLLINE